MMNVGGYQNAVSNYYGSNDVARPGAAKDGGKTRQTAGAKEAARTKETASASASKETAAESKLSQKAQDFLKNLREANEDMDFFVGDSKDDVKQSLAGSNKEFSVVFSAEELEQMAESEDVANEKLNAVRSAMDMARDISEQYNFEGHGITAKIGISFDDDGNTQIFAELEKMSERQRERIEKQREARTEEKKDDKTAGKTGSADRKKLDAYARKNEDTVKKTTLTATDEDDLIEQLQNLDWSKIKSEEPYTAGGRFDFSL